MPSGELKLAHVGLLHFLEPDQNPMAVEGLGTEPDNLVITWKVSHETFRLPPPFLY